MTPNRRLLAIADDLSGAAEVAAALCSRTTRSRVVLVGRPGVVSGGGVSVLDPRHPGEATVLDLDSRYRPATEAAEAVRDALRLSSPDGDTGGEADGETLVLKKIDSLLRGNVAAEIAALAEGGAGVVLAPALPIAGRVVRSGVVHIGGVALHEGDAWRAETVPPPASVSQALGGLPTALIPLTTVRASPPVLSAALRAAVAAGRVAICDAETDADLDAVVKASLAEGPRIRLVGSGGLAVALGRRLTTAPPATSTPAATRATAASATPTATAPATSAETGPTAPDPTGTPATTDPTGSPAADTAGPAPATPATTSPADNAPITAPGAANAPAITTPAGTTASTAGPTVLSANAGAAPTTTAAPGAAVTTAPQSGPATTPAAAAASSAAGTAAPSAGTGRPVLVVVGTAEPAAAEQIRRLVEDGATHHQLPLAGLLSDGPPPRLPPLTAPVTVVSLATSPSPSPVAPGPAPTTDRAVPVPSPRAEHDAVAPADVPGPPPSPAPGSRPATPPPSGAGADRTGPGGSPSAGPADDAGARPGSGSGSVSGRRLVFGLARVIRDAVAAHHGAVDLVLTGGETARRVLDALAVAELDPVGQVHHGAVHLSTPDGRSVVTRPGSFGDPDSLRHIVQALRPHPMERKVTS
ncbi:four-carbon acid sugar kinase family protein [Stenotrophomonas sp. NPDC087984]